MQYRNVQSKDENGNTIYTSGVGTPPALTSADIKAAQPMKITTPSFKPTDISTITSSYGPPQLGENTQKASDLSNKIQSLNEQLSGKSAFQSEQMKAAGIPAIQQAQTDLNTSIKQLQTQSQSLQNAYNYTIPNQQQENVAGRGVTAAGLVPLQAGELRKNQIQQGGLASQALIYSAQSDALANNLVSATRKVEQAVNDRFGTLEAERDARMANLDLILKDPRTTVEEQSRAQAQKDIETQKATQLAEQKANYQSVQKIGIEAASHANNFKPNQQFSTVAMALDAIAKAGSAIEASNIAQATGLIPKQQLDTSITEVNGRKLLINNQTGQAIKDLGSSVSPSSSSSSSSLLSVAEARSFGVPYGTTKAQVMGQLSGAGKSNVISGYNDEFAATISAAANNIKSVAGQKNMREALQSAIANKDYPSAYQFVVQSASQGLTAANKTKLENANIDQTVLSSLRTQLKALSDSGYNTSLLSGTADEIQKKIHVLSTDPKYAAIAVELDRVFQEYRQNMTGAAFSPSESAEYAKVNPSKSNTLALNLAIIDGALKASNNFVEGAIRTSVGQGGIYIKQYADMANAGHNIAPTSNGGYTGKTKSGLDYEIIH